MYRSGGAGVDADPDLEAEVEVVLDEDAGRDENEVDAKVGDLRRVSVSYPDSSITIAIHFVRLTVTLRQSGRHHVGVVDSLNLVDVVAVNPGVKSLPESLQLQQR